MHVSLPIIKDFVPFVLIAGLFPYPALSDAEVLEAVKGGVGFELECPNQCDQEM